MFNPFYCMSCKHQDLPENLKPCIKCGYIPDNDGDIIYDNLGCLPIYRDRILIQNPEHCKNRLWYHSTYVKNWFKEVQKNNILIHAGDKKTAQYVKLASFEKRKHFHRLKINKDAEISQTILTDKNNWDNVDPNKIHLYINRYEVAGHISLIGPAKDFELIEY